MPTLPVFWHHFSQQHPLTAEPICFSLNFIISQRCWRIYTLLLKCLRQILWLLVQVRNYIDWGLSERIWTSQTLSVGIISALSSSLCLTVQTHGAFCTKAVFYSWNFCCWSDFGVADGTAQFSDPSLFLGWCPYGSCVWLGSSETPDNNYL